MIRPLHVLPLLLGLALAAPAQAAPDPDQDLRCFAVGLSLIESNPTAGLTAAMYFMGRLEGREPNTDWYARLARHLETVTPESLQADAQVCGQILVDKGQEMQDRGAELERKSKEQKL